MHGDEAAGEVFAIEAPISEFRLEAELKQGEKSSNKELDIKEFSFKLDSELTVI